MNHVTPQLDKIEDLLGNISGLTDIMQQDLRHKDSDGDVPTLNSHQVGCLLSAIDELANRGYLALDAIEKALQGQGVAS